ncbi:daunorubicin/doxorubicin resistance ABC transporter ATP-binding protein DrrA [Mangrovactinospora gilvigrisea]|uniref:ABC-type xenobiotic transporter n=1 Tax=Mangrovactinospora gilvigrisea TaxID=1428644 RepID=A0A1J7C8W8_9ACTN|nr:daunorubicin/doxorubicin resistance ABC transporter ATP-binding protein DrrA [Mangrovactinospora gilvigrisea]
MVVTDLVKTFGDNRALDGISLTAPRGRVLGVLGPNGAGKTTLVRILATLLRPDGGTAVVDGHDVVGRPQLVRRTIGLTGQYASVDEKLSGRENLYMIGRLLDLPKKDARARADQLLERFNLTDAAGRRAGQYSGGMRRRLDLAASLVGRPRVLYLDEPTTGLDPRARNAVWDEVRELARSGATIVLTTQYMEEAEALAENLVVIDHGKIIARGTPDELKELIGARVQTFRPARPQDAEAVAAALRTAGLAEVRIDDATGAVSAIPADDAQLTAALAAVAGTGVPLASVTELRPSLDEVFLTLTGKGADR